jgi:uncharacterized protein YecE (DUF72 family)
MAEIFIGTAGWNIPKTLANEFAGEGTHLVRYARKMNCAEINSCFHREHRPETYRKWAAAVPDDFRFSMKMSKRVTHEAKLGVEARPLLREFLEQTAGLGEKRGPILLQLPPKLAFDAERVRPFLAMFREMYEGFAAFEPRHARWFTDEAEELLRKFRLARVAADPAVVPEAAHPGGWRGLTYFRLHGSPRRYYSSYSAGDVAGVSQELTEASGTAWCVFDNTASGAALGNALELQASTSSLGAGTGLQPNSSSR